MVTVEVYATSRPAEKIEAIRLLREATGFGLAEATGLLGRLEWNGTGFAVELAGQSEAEDFARRLESLGYGCRLATPGPAAAEPGAAADRAGMS